MTTTRKIVPVILAIASAITLLGVFNPIPARAGWNGQQITFHSTESGVTATSLHIEGPNQSGSHTVFDRYLGAPGYTNYGVSGWWWQGTVTVRIGVAIQNPGLSRQISCVVSMPTVQVGDWVTVNFNRSSCWR